MSAAVFKDQGNKHLQAGEFDLAIEAYSKAIELDSSDHVFFSNRSAAYLSKGDASSALADANTVIQLNATWPKGYSRKGAALHALKRYEEAKEAYEAGLVHAPSDAGLKGGIAEVSKIIETSKRAPPGGGGLFGPQMIQKLAAHPKFGKKLGDPAFLNKLQMMQTNPQLLMSDPELMEVLQVMIGGENMDIPDDDIPSRPFNNNSTFNEPPSKPAGKPKEPEAELTEEQKAEKQYKDRANEAKVRGNALYKDKKFQEAIAAYDEAISIDPANITFINNKAAVYIELGEIDKAIELCNEALEVGKVHRAPYEDKAKVHQRIAAAHLKRSDIAAAIKSYENSQMENYDKAIERKIKNLQLDLRKHELESYVNPELGLQAKERGNAAFRESKFPEAIKEYEEAVKRDPKNAAYRNNLAAAYQKMCLFNDAKREIEKCIEIDPKYVKAWAKKGEIEFFMKEYHKAIDSYRAGLQVDPDNVTCKQGLQKTLQQVNSASGPDSERQAHAMADPEIQTILADPIIRQVLQDLQENPQHAQNALNDPVVRAQIEKLIAAGILQVGK